MQRLSKGNRNNVSKLGFSTKDNYTRCKNSAIYSLAMREHSRRELHNKLKTKEYVEGVDIDELLNELEEKDYLNEDRFTESYIRYRASRGFGSIKISSELQIRGIRQSQIHIALMEAEVDWYKLAEEQQEKKFGKTKSLDFKEKAKRMRFLSTRGFSNDVIRCVIK